MLSRACVLPALALRSSGRSLRAPRSLTPVAARSFASGGKRAKPIKVKKSEARRHVPDAPKAPDALTELPPSSPPAPFLPSEQQTPQTFGGVMKEVRDGCTTLPGEFDGSLVMPAEEGHRHDDEA
ncbi:hypothetical protein BBJ28_00018031 [Nothophytophthora sp. Chile5]|nr:hypothetical protein BBJ28_00018031 [Nothophytophthora sp. Chile5]